MTDETEAALWASIEAAPEDGLRRKVLADHLEETAGMVACDCLNAEYQAGRVSLTWDGVSMAEAGLIVTFSCDRCRGTGRVSDGRAEMAAALRGTCKYFPHLFADMWWFRLPPGPPYGGEWPASADLPPELGEAAGGCRTAARAIRDLCIYYIAVHIKSEVPA